MKDAKTKDTKNFSAYGELPAFTLKYKKVKGINMRVTTDGRLTVSAPFGTPTAEIRRAIAKHLNWINSSLARAQARLRTRPAAVDGGGFVLSGYEYPLRILSGSRVSCIFSGSEIHLIVPDPSDHDQIHKQLEKLLKSQAEKTFKDSLKRMYPLVQQLGAPLPGLKIRRMTSRWGSCKTSEHIITLNLCLARAPLCLVDYVMLHELIHLLNPPHDARFYELFAALMPDYKNRKQLLDSSDYIY